MIIFPAQTLKHSIPYIDMDWLPNISRDGHRKVGLRICSVQLQFIKSKSFSMLLLGQSFYPSKYPTNPVI